MDGENGKSIEINQIHNIKTSDRWFAKRKKSIVEREWQVDTVCTNMYRLSIVSVGYPKILDETFAAALLTLTVIINYHTQCGWRCSQLLQSMICTCLKMAGTDGALTIAFPTVGCGYLKYAPDDVADCFIEACQQTRSNIKVCDPRLAGQLSLYNVPVFQRKFTLLIFTMTKLTNFNNIW